MLFGDISIAVNPRKSRGSWGIPGVRRIAASIETAEVSSYGYMRAVTCILGMSRRKMPDEYLPLKFPRLPSSSFLVILPANFMHPIESAMS